MRNPLIPRLDIESVQYPAIEPVPEGTPRPFWSVMIPTYNRPQLLAETLKSILAENIPADEMQITVIDNGTTEFADEVVREVGQGRVEYFQQPKSVPLAENWTTCIRLSRGVWVHMPHDDNQIMPGCYAAYHAYIEQYQANVLISTVMATDDEGRWMGMTNPVHVVDGLASFPPQFVFQNNTFNINTLIVRRDLYEQIGGYPFDFHYGCDQEICMRLFDVGKVGFLPRPYIYSAMHKEQDSYRFWVNEGFQLKHLRTWQCMLRGKDTPDYRKLVYHGLSDGLYGVSHFLHAKGFYRPALHQANWAFRLQPSFKTLVNVLVRVYFWLLYPPIRSVLSIFPKIRRVLGVVKRRTLRALRA